MRNLITPTRLIVGLTVLLLAAGAATAADKKLMHCFVFTPVEAATQADWEAFYKATDELPGKVPGLSRVWAGKLARNLAILGTDRETSKKLAAGEKEVSGPLTRRVRSYGVCMEFADEAALKAYAPHPAHKEWEKVYEKVREYGTTTFDILPH
ncbi:MAG: hypothetical protein FJW34_18780 [Acidobacteria bacterium]|nr:hypothetical protein [Acidobacteriota bacterium]